MCTGNGADANIFDSCTLNSLKASGVENEIEKLRGPRTFNIAACNPDGKRAKIICTWTATLDAELHIRLVTGLTFRLLLWFVTQQYLCEPLLGRTFLEALGLNTRDILAPVGEKHAGVVYAATILEEDFQEYRTLRVLEGVFHADGGADDADLDENGGWLDLGPEDADEK